jgi:hypothetical protein
MSFINYLAGRVYGPHSWWWSVHLGDKRFRTIYHNKIRNPLRRREFEIKKSKKSKKQRNFGWLSWSRKLKIYMFPRAAHYLNMKITFVTVKCSRTTLYKLLRNRNLTYSSVAKNNEMKEKNKLRNDYWRILFHDSFLKNFSTTFSMNL